MSHSNSGMAQLLLILLGVSFIWGCASSSSRFLSSHHHESDSTNWSENEISSVRLSEDNPNINRRTLLACVMPLMGVPYLYDGSDTTGFDCSGFTAKIYADVLGKALPHSTVEQFDAGEPVDRHALQFGDLVFFAMDRDTPSHVGIYVGDGLFAHASVSLGVTISLMESTYYKKRYCGARRIIK